MIKEFVNYEMALALKELGFDEPCFTYYYNITGKLRTNLSIDINNDMNYMLNKKLGITLAPTFSQAFRFFREKYNMLANVYSNASGFCYEYSDTIGGTHRFDSGFNGPNDSGCWDSYEDAEIACLQKMIETIKNK